MYMIRMKCYKPIFAHVWIHTLQTALQRSGIGKFIKGSVKGTIRKCN